MFGAVRPVGLSLALPQPTYIGVHSAYRPHLEFQVVPELRIRIPFSKSQRFEINSLDDYRIFTGLVLKSKEPI